MKATDNRAVSAVQPGAATDRRVTAQRHAQQRCARNRREHQGQRERQLLEDDVRNLAPAERILTEVPGRDVAEKPSQLHDKWLIQPHALIEFRAQFGRCAWPEDHAGRVAGQHVNHAEQQRYGEHHDQYRQGDTAGDETQHEGQDSTWRAMPKFWYIG